MIAFTSTDLEGPALETSESTAGSLEGVGTPTDSTTEASYLAVGTSGTASTVVLTSTALGSTAAVFLTATSPFTSNP